MRTVLGKVMSGVALLAVSLGVPVAGRAADVATLTTRAASTQTVEFDVFLPLEHREDLQKLLVSLQDPKSPEFHQWLKPTEFDARFGASPDKVSAIQNELASHGMQITQVGPRQLHVRGGAQRVETMFSSQLKNGTFASGEKTVAFSKPFLLPASISAADGVVTGLSGRIWMHTHSRMAAAGTGEPLPDNRYGPTGGYWFTDLKQAYSFPSYEAYDGTGSTVGILISGGYLPSDMARYFGHEKIAPPNVTEVKLGGGAPFGVPDSVETALDLQQAGGMAPKAQLVLYNMASLTTSNVLSGLATVVQQNAVDVLSMSFGAPERAYSPEYNDGQDYSGILQIYDDLFSQGNAQGISFVASSGDYGALDIPPVSCLDSTATAGCGTMQPSVEIPASSPHVTAVGGTNLVTGFAPSAPLNSKYVRENADDDPLVADPFGTPASGAVWGSGGGDSYYFSKPDYQTLVATGSKFRTVPDVSLQMGGCPSTAVQPCGPDRSYVLTVWNNRLLGLIGTSVSAPDFAGLLALKVQRDQSRQGNTNYVLYLDAAGQRLGLVRGIFRENIPGYNGYYSTKPGYDRVLGIGTVRGLNFLQAPEGTPVAGTPQTPSNP